MQSRALQAFTRCNTRGLNSRLSVQCVTHPLPLGRRPGVSNTETDKLRPAGRFLNSWEAGGERTAVTLMTTTADVFFA